MVGWIPLFLLVLRKLWRHRFWTARLGGRSTAVAL